MSFTDPKTGGEAPSAEARGGGAPGRGAPAVVRAARLLRLLEAAPGREVPLAELAADLGAAKSSTLSVCAALEETGLIVRGGGGYRLGRAVLELAGSYLAGFDQLRAFYDLCRDSEALEREVVQIALLEGTDVIYLARHEGRVPYRFSAGIGSRFPASSTAVGHALLAGLEDGEVERRFASAEAFPRLTPHSVTDLPTLLAALHRTRARGYALDQEGVHPGIVGVAARLPPWNPADAPLSVGASIMATEATPARVEEVGEALGALVEALSNPLVSR